MKKLFIILILNLSLFMMYGCVRDKDDANGDPIDPNRNPNIDIDIDEDIYKEEPNSAENKEPVKDTSDKESIIYKNDVYGFNLEIPGWWEGTYAVEEEAWFDEISTSISFNFKDGEIYSNVFTIVIYDETIKREDWEDPFLIYIDEKGGKTFAYLQAMEPPVDVLEEENDKYLRTISKMVEEVPGIIETFKIKNF